MFCLGILERLQLNIQECLSPLFAIFRGEGVRSRGGEKYFVVGGSRDTCHARRRKRLVKEWQKKELDEEEWFSKKTKKKKQQMEGKKTDNQGVAAANRQCHRAQCLHLKKWPRK